MKMVGRWPWVLEVVLLALSYAIYRAIEGNFLELAVMLPISAVVAYIQYRVVRLEPVRRTAGKDLK